MTPKNPHASNELTNFLEKIGGRISDDTWHSMKVHLQGIVIFFFYEKVSIFESSIYFDKYTLELCNNQIKGWHFCMFLYDWLLTCYFFKRVRGSRVCWKNETNKYVK